MYLSWFLSCKVSYIFLTTPSEVLGSPLQSDMKKVTKIAGIYKTSELN